MVTHGVFKMTHMLLFIAVLVTATSTTYSVMVNYCGQNSCCNTTSCNNCASNCYANCSSATCTQNCIDNCLLVSPEDVSAVVTDPQSFTACPNGNCNSCIGSNCCNTQQCNNCVQDCNVQCSTGQCKQNCAHNCIHGIAQHCQGGSCNYCGASHCCNTETCNGCAHTCTSQCSTQNCKQNCVSNCIHGISQSCNSGSCHSCSGSHCCRTEQCNSCAHTCTAGCSTQQCRHNCVQNCVQTTPQHCQGGNCGFCSGSQCCNTQHCNRCANSCTSQCSTSECQNTCVNKCIHTTPSCNGPNCNVCIGRHCCNTANCNTCVNQCYNQTPQSGCTNNCVRKCMESGPTKVDIPFPDLSCDAGSSSVVGSSSDQSEAANITNTISIQNLINNTNIIHIPIKINSTNINTINYARKSKSPTVDVFKRVETLNGQTQKPHSCCYVIHPRECFHVHEEVLGKLNETHHNITHQNQTEGRKIRCIRRRHKECSDICTSPVVVIIPVPHPMPVPHPQPYPVRIPSQQQRCHYIQQHPWVYCGDYQKHDCGGCYYCGGQYNPEQCSARSECPQVCRHNLFVGQQHQGGYNCIPYNNGVRCV